MSSDDDRLHLVMFAFPTWTSEMFYRGCVIRGTEVLVVRGDLDENGDTFTYPVGDWVPFHDYDGACSAVVTILRHAEEEESSLVLVRMNEDVLIPFCAQGYLEPNLVAIEAGLYARPALVEIRREARSA